MNAFRLSFDQAVKIIGAIVAEALNADGDRQVDTLTSASWTAALEFGGDALPLATEEIETCARRVQAFFGRPHALAPLVNARTLGDWARVLTAELETEFAAIRFAPAGAVDPSGFCRHAVEDVYADAAAAANLLYGRRRVLSLVAPHSLLGLTLTVLTPNLQKIPSVDGRAMPPEQLRDALQFGDALVATPTLWRYMLQQNVTAPDNAMGVYFGEPMTPELSAEMRQAGFGAQREIYGSTETGLIGWRDSPTEPFILFDQWSRNGEELIRLTTDGAERSVRPMDILQWTGDRRFLLSGRRDGALQVGAVNVFPERIADAINAHDLVEDCVIRAARLHSGANRLIAHIKLEATAPPTEKTVREIDQWCRTRLRPQERPSIFHFEASLDQVRAIAAAG
ncbi:MAG: hypothetical protein AAGJ87_06525 [Pseudomonadota bacterium]